MFERLQAAVSDQAPAGALLNGPQAVPQRSLMFDLLRDFLRHILGRVGPDPPGDERVLVDLDEDIGIVWTKRAKLKTVSDDREQVAGDRTAIPETD
jgi:hypothetical protein